MRGRGPARPGHFWSPRPCQAITSRSSTSRHTHLYGFRQNVGVIFPLQLFELLNDSLYSRVPLVVGRHVFDCERRTNNEGKAPSGVPRPYSAGSSGLPARP